MINSCVLKTPEYQTRLAQSGIPEPIFNTKCSIFLQKYNRLPNLDELPNVNSEPHLAETLNMTDVNSAMLDDILAVTGTSSIKEANAKINDTYSDLEVTLTPLLTEAIVDIEHRPSIYSMKETEPVEVVENPNMRSVIFDITNKLANLYGIKINVITSRDLIKFEQVPGIDTASAFIYNDEIYINADSARADAPIHEMTHLLLGSIRYKNPDLYFNLVQLAEKFPSYTSQKLYLQGRAESDILEEIFVEEVGKYLAGYDNEISSLPKDIQYELHYNINRLLDSVLMGDISVNSVGNKAYSMTLPELVKEVNSKLLQPNFCGTLDDAKQHRILANVKQDLIEKGDLKEVCE